MRALTIKQPWAQLIAEGFKDVENRTWSTRWRGPLLIHAGLQCDVLAQMPPQLDARDREAARETWLRAHNRRGAIVGMVQLIDDVEHDPSPWALPEHRHWKFVDAVAFDTPIMAGGRQGLWMPSEKELQRVEALLEAAKERAR